MKSQATLTGRVEVIFSFTKVKPHLREELKSCFHAQSQATFMKMWLLSCECPTSYRRKKKLKKYKVRPLGHWCSEREKESKDSEQS